MFYYCEKGSYSDFWFKNVKT